jgi:hypothetical protein
MIELPSPSTPPYLFQAFLYPDGPSCAVDVSDCRGQEWEDACPLAIHGVGAARPAQLMMALET